MRGLKNNAMIFEARGDPWDDSTVQRSLSLPQPTALEERLESALRKHGMTARYAGETRLRYATTPDPELDSFTKASKAPVRVEPPSAFKRVEPHNGDKLKRIAERVLVMQRALAARKVKTIR